MTVALRHSGPESRHKLKLGKVVDEMLELEDICKAMHKTTTLLVVLSMATHNKLSQEMTKVCKPPHGLGTG